MSQARRGFLLAAAGSAAGLAGHAQSAAISAEGSVRTEHTPAPRTRAEVFGHRGACALRPEHTLASYAQAIADGADYIEPDLVTTRDGVLVARHENNLRDTTDVARHAEFAARRTVKVIDGMREDGWFAEDFSLAELKTLRAVERIPLIRPHNTRYDGQFQIPTWDEIIDFVAAEAATRQRTIGLIPELKHSTYFASLGLALEPGFVRALDGHHHTRTQPVEIQSFEIANLRVLRAQLGRRANVRLMQLVGVVARPADVVAAGHGPTFGEMVSAGGLRIMAGYADVVAPPSRVLVPWNTDQTLGAPGPIIDAAHAAGLLVHTWTFRPENRFLPAEFRNAAGENARNEAGSVAEIRHFLQLGIDGFFTDDPAIGRRAADG